MAKEQTVIISASYLRKLIEDGIKREAEDIAVHKAVRTILDRHEGKQITKRIASDLEKAYPEWKVYYDVSYGMFHLNVRTPERIKEAGESDGKLSDYVRIFIGYNTSPFVSVASFEEHDASNGYAAERRNQERQALADNLPRLTEIANVINTYNELVPRIEKILDHPGNPEYFTFRKLLVPNDMNTGR